MKMFILLICLFSPLLLAEGNVEKGKIKSQVCVTCHGEFGKGKIERGDQPAAPRLAGQVPEYFIKSMHDYKADRRFDPLMNALSKGLTDEDIENLAAYYSTIE